MKNYSVRELINFKHKYNIISFSKDKRNERIAILKCLCSKIYKHHLTRLLNRKQTSLCKSCAIRKTCKNKTVYLDGLPKTVWSRLLSKLKIRKLDINITPKYIYDLYIKQNNICSLSGIPINFEYVGKKSCSASLDRIDSSKGYTKGNVQWVYKHINMMKQTYSQEYFIDMCRKVTEHQDSLKVNL